MAMICSEDGLEALPCEGTGAEEEGIAEERKRVSLLVLKGRKPDKQLRAVLVRKAAESRRGGPTTEPRQDSTGPCCWPSYLLDVGQLCSCGRAGMQTE